MLFFSAVPPHTASDAEALQHFSREFEQRYGTTHPSFYLGSLEDAIKEAFNGSAKEVSGTQCNSHLTYNPSDFERDKGKRGKE